MKTHTYTRIAVVLAVIVAVQATGPSAQARPQNEPLVISGLDEQGRIRLTPGKSVIITTKRAQKRISIGDPSIVDVTGISPTRILATARKSGTTEIIVWDEQDLSQAINVIVTADMSGLREQLEKLFPNTRIEATASEDAVVLRGSVPSLAVAEQAQALAAPYGKNVVNLLEVAGGQQVLLQVRVAEVSKSATRQLGVNFGYNDGTSFGATNIGKVSPFTIVPSEAFPDTPLLGIPTPGDAVTLFGRGEIGSTAFHYFVSALRENNLLRILAEPNLVALSGQEASFLAGGEFPIPVPQSGTGNDTTITIEFREFGVRLSFVPVVLGDGRIRLKLSPEVSDLDFTTAVRFGGFVVPGLTQRKVTTTVEVMDGESLAIAGLLNQNVTANKQVIPILGDIPVIGPLFRSVRYQRKETELVVLVTPRLVTGIPSNTAAPLPGEHWRHPTEFDQYFYGDIGGQRTDATTQPSENTRRSPRPFAGSFGFAPAEAPTASN
jgi:pilus assembly protein CpaC